MQTTIEQNRTFFRLDSLANQYEQIKSRLNITYRDIARELSTSYDAVRMSFKRGSFTELQLDVIERSFGISRNWLMTGKGEMLLDSSVISEPTEKYNKESGLRMLSIFEDYIPDELADMYKKLQDELADLYEYKELYYKAKEAYRPK